MHFQQEAQLTPVAVLDVALLAFLRAWKLPGPICSWGVVPRHVPVEVALVISALPATPSWAIEPDL